MKLDTMTQQQFNEAFNLDFDEKNIECRQLSRELQEGVIEQDQPRINYIKQFLHEATPSQKSHFRALALPIAIAAVCANDLALFIDISQHYPHVVDPRLACNANLDVSSNLFYSETWQGLSSRVEFIDDDDTDTNKFSLFRAVVESSICSDELRTRVIQSQVLFLRNALDDEKEQALGINIARTLFAGIPWKNHNFLSIAYDFVRIETDTHSHINSQEHVVKNMKKAILAMFIGECSLYHEHFLDVLVQTPILTAEVSVEQAVKNPELAARYALFFLIYSVIEQLPDVKKEDLLRILTYVMTQYDNTGESLFYWKTMRAALGSQQFNNYVPDLLNEALAIESRIFLTWLFDNTMNIEGDNYWHESEMKMFYLCLKNLIAKSDESTPQKIRFFYDSFLTRHHNHRLIQKECRDLIDTQNNGTSLWQLSANMPEVRAMLSNYRSLPHIPARHGLWGAGMAVAAEQDVDAKPDAKFANCVIL